MTYGLTSRYRKEYGSYKNMLHRCYKEKAPNYKWYYDLYDTAYITKL